MPRQKRDDVPVKIERKIYRKAKLIAAHRDISLAEYLSGLLGKQVDKDHEKMRHEIDESSSD